VRASIVLSLIGSTEKIQAVNFQPPAQSKEQFQFVPLAKSSDSKPSLPRENVLISRRPASSCWQW